MKVDLSKVQEIIIQDKSGDIVDRFQLASATLVKDKILGTYLKLQKVTEQTIKKEKRTHCYCGQPIDFSNPDCAEFNLCKDHAADS